MKTNLLPGALVVFYMCVRMTAQSQPASESTINQRGNDNDNTYAVTDMDRNGFKWIALRTLDMRSGTYSNVLVNLLNNNETQPPAGTPPVIAYNGVAAMALDEENKKLFYTPMLTDQLYYIDLRTMSRHLVTNQFTGLMPKANDQSNIVTRMVIGDDNKGYALTNDGNHLIRFRTNGNNPNITDLGALVDAPGNNEMSIHNLCSSFGGDLIADDDDHLYLFTKGNHVFKINVQSKVAKFLGTVTGLPSRFTTSGAVVNKPEKKIVIVSATDSTDIYTVNFETLVARPLNANRPYHPADLANNSVLKTREQHGHNDNRIVLTSGETNSNIQLYPNPITEREFKIQFGDALTGNYTIGVTDARGKSILSKAVTVVGKNNTIVVSLPGITTSGIYFVRVTGNNNVYTTKILVE